MLCVTWPEILFSVSFHVVPFGQNESCKRKLHDLKNDLSICFLSCSGLHDRKNCFGNFFGKHVGANSTSNIRQAFRTIPLLQLLPTKVSAFLQPLPCTSSWVCRSDMATLTAAKPPASPLSIPVPKGTASGARAGSSTGGEVRWHPRPPLAEPLFLVNEQYIRSEKSQNESFPNFWIFLLNCATNFAPNLPRILLMGDGQKDHQKSLPFWMQNSQGNSKKNSHKNFLASGQSNSTILFANLAPGPSPGVSVRLFFFSCYLAFLFCLSIYHACFLFLLFQCCCFYSSGSIDYSCPVMFFFWWCDSGVCVLKKVSSMIWRFWLGCFCQWFLFEKGKLNLMRLVGCIPDFHVLCLRRSRLATASSSHFVLSWFCFGCSLIWT